MPRKTATAEKQGTLIPDLDLKPAKAVAPAKPAKPKTTAVAKAEPPAPTGNNVVAIRQEAPPANFAELLWRAATDKRVDTGKMRELLTMQKEMDEAKAVAEFGAAMLRVQALIPPITKDGEGDRKIRYAKLETIAKRIGQTSRDQGFSMSWGQEDSPRADHYRVVCYLSHSGGHTRKYYYDSPLDNVGPNGSPNKTKTQGAASATTYARRQLTVLMFNVVIQDQDDDGTNDLSPKITEEQVRNLDKSCKAVGADLSAFLNYLGVQNLGLLPADRYEYAVATLDRYAASTTKRQERAGR